MENQACPQCGHWLEMDKNIPLTWFFNKLPYEEAEVYNFITSELFRSKVTMRKEILCEDCTFEEVETTKIGPYCGSRVYQVVVSRDMDVAVVYTLDPDSDVIWWNEYRMVIDPTLEYI